MGVGKRTETFLPVESARNPAAIIDDSGRSRLNVANQIRERNVRSLTDEAMKMIRHVVDGYKLLPLSRDDPGHVLFAAHRCARAESDSAAPCTVKTIWM